MASPGFFQKTPGCVTHIAFLHLPSKWGWVKTLVPRVNPKIAGKWMFIPLKCIYRYWPIPKSWNLGWLYGKKPSGNPLIHGKSFSFDGFLSENLRRNRSGMVQQAMFDYRMIKRTHMEKYELFIWVNIPSMCHPPGFYCWFMSPVNYILSIVTYKYHKTYLLEL